MKFPTTLELFFAESDWGAVTQTRQGTGLGFVIVKMLVEQQGDELTVESVKGEGRTFAFSTPVAGEQ